MNILRTTLASVAFAVAATAAHGADWVSLGEAKGVKLYEQSEPGQQFKGFRGVVRVKASLKTVLAVLLVRENFPQWFSNMREDSTLVKNNPDASLCYIWIKGVWPTLDRDVVAKVTVDQDPVTLAVSVIAQNTDPTLVPTYPDRVRMAKLYSGFVVRPLSATETEVQLDGLADPSGNIPAFAANMVAKNIPRDTLANLAALVETPGKVDLSVYETNRFASLALKKLKFPTY